MGGRGGGAEGNGHGQSTSQLRVVEGDVLGFAVSLAYTALQWGQEFMAGCSYTGLYIRRPVV